jgi:hypothetical protein
MISVKSIITKHIPIRIGLEEETKTAAMTKKTILCFLFFITGIFLSTQNLHAQKLKTLIADGDNAFADNDFFGAAIYYNQAILQDSTDMAIQYKYAD